MKKYIKQQRDYTVVGITAVIDAMVGDVERKAYGGGFDEVISIVKDGVYYHYEVEGGREEASRYILRAFNEGKIDPEKMYKKFDRKVTIWEEFLDQHESNFSLKTFVTFCLMYQSLFPPAYVGMDAIDLVHELPKEKREAFSRFTTKMRRRGEVIYKNGEVYFIPRYTEWLSKHLLTKYLPEELRYLTWFELLQYIEQKKNLPTPEQLRERIQTLYIRQYDTNAYELAQGAEAEKIIKQKALFNQRGDILSKLNELRGAVAYPGVVRGVVRLVRSRKEISKFQSGEVLVSQMTDPHFLSIMKQAIAFVTNEGGILCHAAIVARELKKPCVIGTKYATHFLKDGDMVEVDAIKGIVRKI